jgi:hypothetical protein
MPFFSLSPTGTVDATSLRGFAVSATAPATGAVLGWSGSAWLPTPGVTGPTGPESVQWLYGSGAPSAGIGRSNDFYLDTTNGVLYGPKASGSWGAGLQLQTGQRGPTGPAGATGAAGQSITGPSGAVGATGSTGAAGRSVVAVAGAPVNAVGSNGDIAWDVTNRLVYGPKANGAWPAGTSVVGPTGPTGSLTIADVIAAVGSNATLRAAIKSAANS